MKIAILGFGNMGQTYASSFVSSGFIKSEDIFVLTRNLATISNKYSIPDTNFFTEINPSFLSVDIVILAVKPQDFENLCFQIKDFITENHLILSVMAGISIENISEKLQVKKVIRAMPNIPTQIGQGMTVFTSSPNVDRKDLFIIQNLINTTGKSLFIEDENRIDAATAISGSGPAYVYYFMNAMVKAAQTLGFSESEAQLLVHQTFLGATQLQNRSNLSYLEWIDKVSSKGGTTEAALHVLQSNQTESIFINAIFQANSRAKELGKVIDK